MIFWCYEKCSTCRKAQKKLDELGVHYEWRSIVTQSPSKEELLAFLKQQPDPKKLFNSSGKKYREYQLKEKLKDMSLEDMAELLASDGMLIKRPLLWDGENLLIGYKEAEYNCLGDR